MQVKSGMGLVGAFVAPTDGGRSAPFDVKTFGFMGPTVSERAELAVRNGGGRHEISHMHRGGAGARVGGGGEEFNQRAYVMGSRGGTPRDAQSMAGIMSMGLPFGGGADPAPATLARYILARAHTRPPPPTPLTLTSRPGGPSNLISSHLRAGTRSSAERYRPGIMALGYSPARR